MVTDNDIHGFVWCHKKKIMQKVIMTYVDNTFIAAYYTHWKSNIKKKNSIKFKQVIYPDKQKK